MNYLSYKHKYVFLFGFLIELFVSIFIVQLEYEHSTIKNFTMILMCLFLFVTTLIIISVDNWFVAKKNELIKIRDIKLSKFIKFCDLLDYKSTINFINDSCINDKLFFDFYISKCNIYNKPNRNIIQFQLRLFEYFLVKNTIKWSYLKNSLEKNIYFSEKLLEQLYLKSKIIVF